MKQTLTRTSILTAACFCFVTSLTAQTISNTQKDQRLVASLSKSDSMLPMQLTPNAVPTALPNSSPEPGVTSLSLADNKSAPVAPLLTSSLVNPSFLSPATPVRWTAVPAAADHSSGRNSWIGVEPGTLPLIAPIHPELSPYETYGAAPIVVNLRFGHK
ncbi:MAG TPA: hypothetical protein VH351_10230 [Bryobacteraceae bacterium]|nr:hypothetical protein [Bryobacteraceae bacterium]